MQYLKRESFTIPTNSGKIAQLDWDRAFLSAEEFIAKYGVAPEPTEPGDQTNGR